MLRWFQARYSRPLIVALVATTFAALVVVGGLLWVQQQRGLELRLAFAQAEAGRLAGLLNALVARVDQAVIGLISAPGLVERADCDERVAQIAQTLPAAVTGFALIDAAGIITCSSLPALRGQRSATSVQPSAEQAAAPLISFIIPGGVTQAPLIIVQRPTPHGGIVAAGLRVEALRQLATTPLAAALEDSRGVRVSLSDGQVSHVAAAAYFPPAADAVPVTEPTGRRIVARISDHLAVTLDMDGATPADARAAALIATGWVSLALAGGFAVILVVARLTLLRPLRRLGEQLDGALGPEGLSDWLNAHPASPMRHMAERIMTREVSQEQRVALREALLREVNHRMAGHLQMVASLLRLQARETGPAEVTDALRRAEYRVNTLALVHQGLQQARRGNAVDLLDLLRRVAVNLVEGSPMADYIGLNVEGEVLIVPSEIGVPVALILNEWMTGALQAEWSPRTISIALERHGDDGLLTYDDGGAGREGREGGRLSMTIGEALCAQIGAHRENWLGSGWRLTFPLDPSTHS